MTKPWQLIGLLMFAVAAKGWAQHAPHAAAPAPHAKTADQTSKQPAETRGAESEEQAKTFRGIAAKLNTTPDALEAAYQQAKSTNPKLTRGQFVAATMLGHNLSRFLEILKRINIPHNLRLIFSNIYNINTRSIVSIIITTSNNNSDSNIKW